MHIAPFGIEHFFARYEFNTPHLLCASDCESLTVDELLALNGTSAAVLGDLDLSYTESQGATDLREAITASYERMSADEVVVLSAPEEGIFVALHALLEPEDEAIVLTPAYDSLRNVVEYLVGEERVKTWEVQPTHGGWRLDLERLERLVTPHTRLLVINFPHNPTGHLPDLATFRTILELASQHELWIFSDEMYRGLEASADERLPSVGDVYRRSVTLSGLSKVHGLPGLRTGWLLVPDENLRQSIMNWKHYTTICPPAPSERLALAALQAQDRLRGRNRAIIDENLTLADAFFACWPDHFTWRRPRAGSVALVEWRPGRVEDHCHGARQEAGVLLLPGSYFRYGNDYFRLGVGRQSFAAGLEAYESYLSAAS